MKSFLATLYFIFVGSCIFDPANKLLGLKMPLFIVIMTIYLLQRRGAIVEKKILFYVYSFSLALPLLSIGVSLLFSSAHIDLLNSISWLKPFMFLFFTFSLYKSSVNGIKILAIHLSILCVIIVTVYILSIVFNVPVAILYEFGNKYGIFSIQQRDFGSLTVFSMYFHTSPLIVFAICYYAYNYIQTRRKSFLFLLVLSMSGLFLSGTRNNLFMSVLCPALIFFYYGSTKFKTSLIFLGFFLIFSILASGVFSEFFSPKEKSNSIKLAYIPDYINAYSNIQDLTFGQGLGSTFYVNVHKKMVDNTELSYFELLRRFGIIITVAYVILLNLPFLYLNRQTAWLLIAYFNYLIMINSNPFFFSSNGMLLLSIVLVFMVRNNNENKRIAVS